MSPCGLNELFDKQRDVYHFDDFQPLSVSWRFVSFYAIGIVIDKHLEVRVARQLLIVRNELLEEHKYFSDSSWHTTHTTENSNHFEYMYIIRCQELLNVSLYSRVSITFG